VENLEKIRALPQTEQIKESTQKHFFKALFQAQKGGLKRPEIPENGRWGVQLTGERHGNTI
jgi:hypothetical protein